MSHTHKKTAKTPRGLRGRHSVLNIQPGGRQVMMKSQLAGTTGLGDCQTSNAVLHSAGQEYGITSASDKGVT
jgi:hypothetical protein